MFFQRLATSIVVFGTLVYAVSLVSAEDIIVRSVEVKTTKANGDPWDIGGGKVARPDLYVIVQRDRFEENTRTIQDSFDGTFNEKSLRVEDGDRVRFSVMDEDLFADDTIGSTSLTITSSLLRKGSVTLEFDQVQSLRIDFQ